MKGKENLLEGLSVNIQGLKIAIPKELFNMEIDEEIRKIMKNSIKIFEKLGGANIEEISMSHIKYSSATYNIISNVEASSSLSRFDGIRYGYRTEKHNTLDELYKNTRGEGLGWETKKRILAGNYYLTRGNRENIIIRQ